ncbi:MAG TPA: DUF6600 domain-containing protein [Verrucomicrobiae bacterium]|nr:DUF6600 domain-containing protein [Verrucomicrobiae bacterium]
MKTIRLSSGRVAFAVVFITIGWMFWSGGNAFTADQAPPSNLSPGLQEVVKLSKAQMGDDVILAYIKNSGASYTLSADDILYLKSQGVSQNVISALLQTKSAASAPSVSPPPPLAASGVPPEPGSEEPSAAPTPTPQVPVFQSVANTGNAEAGFSALVQEHNGYTFEMKECKLEDRQDRPANDGRPHLQLACKVLVTDKMGDRKLSMCAEKDSEHTRVIDDMGNEYNCSGGSLGSSIMRYWGGLWPAELVLPSGVPVNATLSFGVNQGVGYFSQEAKSLAILDIVFKSNDTGAGSFHIQFKNVPIPLVEAPPAPVATAPPPAPESGASTVSTAPAPSAEPVVNADYVQQQLSPYGSWVDVPGYGQCWQPSDLPPGWRPYYDSGHWVYTDAGMYWQSDYPWGAIPFHYGRWAWVGGYGWIWVPGYEYAPAWVIWRHADGYLGWAPLPYRAVWVAGGWWEYRGVRVAADYDFGFGPSFFVFVGHDHLWEHDYHHFILHGEELHRIYRASVVNRIVRDEHGRFVHDGLDRAHLERFTGRNIAVVPHEELQNRELAVLRADRDRVVGHEPPIKPHGKLRQGEPKQGEPRQGQPKQGEKPGQREKSGEEKHKGDKKDQNQSKGNTNQHFAQVKGSASS